MYPVIEVTPETTKQDIFDAVTRHLANQRQWAKKPNSGPCAYRQGSLACAVGCLVTDSEAAAMDANTSALGIDGQKATGLLPQRLTRFYPLLSALQDVHDDSMPASWPSDLATTAKICGLDATVVVEAFGS